MTRPGRPACQKVESPIMATTFSSAAYCMPAATPRHAPMLSSESP